MYHEIWDRNALRNAFIKDNPDIFDEVRNEAASKAAAKATVEATASAKREMAKGLREDGVPMEIIVRRSGLSEEEIKAL